MNLRTTQTQLQRILTTAVMSPMLKKAVSATIEALKNKDLKLAHQITACKSYVVGEIDTKDTEHAFQEDEAANKKALGDSLYSILDGVHFEIAMAADEMPSGIVALSTRGATSMRHKGTHPVVQRIIDEDRAIRAK